MLLCPSVASAIVLALVSPVLLSADERDSSRRDEATTLSNKEYGIEVEVPASWKLVSKAVEAMVFGFSIPNDDPTLEAGVKCEIGPAPETLDEYRTRIDRRAERQKVPGVSLKQNEVVKTDTGERLVTEWNYEPKDRPIVHDFEVRVIRNDQLYIFTLRAPGPLFPVLRPQFESLPHC